MYFEGIAGDQFLELIEHTVNQVNSYSSRGSGLIIDRIEKMQTSFAAFSPIRAGSYLELPDALSKTSTLLTNINTKDDDRCFLYCFVAAYHNVNEPALYPTSRRWLEKNKVSTYDLDKEGIVRIKGEYEMPMSLMDMDRFEKLINILHLFKHPLYFIPNLGIKTIFLLRYKDGKLLPIRVSSRFTTSLIVDLLLLTDGSKYHYVLISDLQKVVEYVRHKVHRFQSEICRNCFHTCASFETLKRHQEM